MEEFDRKKLIEKFSEQTGLLISEILGKEVNLKSIDLVVTPPKIKGYVSFLNFIEDINGTIICNFDEKSAINIASAMNGIDIEKIENPDEMDELIEASLSEIVNMIGGKAMTDFDEFGIKCNITPPTILKGDNLKLFEKSSFIYILNYFYEDNEILIMIVLKKNK